MELQLIGDDKLKVLLTPFDMMKHNLTLEKLNYENTETRKAIWEILDDAKHETGFDAASGRICIEVYPEKSGGCIIYISKVKEESEGKTDKKEGIKEKSAVFRFDDTESMLQVCKFLNHTGYRDTSAAYYEEISGGFRYYLQLIVKLFPNTGKRAKYLQEYLFISEFGTRLEGKAADFYLLEHASPFCEEKAVQILGKLAR